MILPDGFSKYGNSFITSDDNQYGFYFLRDYNLINYSSYIYPNVSINKECSNISDLANYIKLLNQDYVIQVASDYYDDEICAQLKKYGLKYISAKELFDLYFM